MPQVVRRSQRTGKGARVEARLSAKQKRRIEYAARLRGTSLSEFMVSSADHAAMRTIELHETWSLTDRNREVFVRALLHPPAPSALMKAAVRQYRRRVTAS